MSKIKLLSIAVIGLLIVNLGIVSFLLLRKPPHPRGFRPEMNQLEGRPEGQAGPKNIIIERLHFDKEQVAAYEKLIEQHQATVKNIRDSIRMAKTALYNTLNNETFAGKDSVVNELNLLQRNLELAHYQHFAALKKICKPEQTENFDKLTHDLARFFSPEKNNPPSPKD